jgi:predicted nuclease with RNAse H fold
MTAQYFVGFDPGGKSAFGWAVLEVLDENLRYLSSGTCSDARSAFNSVTLPGGATPSAVGIDSPLYWEAGEERRADKDIRKALRTAGKPTSTVIHVNSLRGACLVQGALVANFAAEAWPDTRITEAHPKALVHLWPETTAFITSLPSHVINEHEIDSAVAAYSAYMYLVDSLGEKDLARNIVTRFPRFRCQVGYWFPIAGSSSSLTESASAPVE